jgi:hypothetical protein
MRRILSKLRSNSTKVTEKSAESTPRQKQEVTAQPTKTEVKQVDNVPQEEQLKAEEPTTPQAHEATEPVPKSESQTTITQTMSEGKVSPSAAVVVEAANVQKYPVPKAYFE